ncbi:unnamed protein product [Echinostoma caproni]|uniref:Bromo domain-containing protein n=1 Tax=Echinostoma caproni TaxID=27848 RepID=A0A183AK51_9TREM|nr:unnamed protein product [Echinostoma caproni]
MTKLPALEATEILNLLARKMTGTQKGLANHWEFHPTDHDFIRRFPDIVQQQSAAWEMRIRQLCVQLKLEHLVSDGARRRRRGSGRLSSESGSEAEYDIPSLVSGVHVSGGTNKRRRRQLSLSQADSSSSGGREMDGSAGKEPPRKRARTQSLSVAALNSTPPNEVPNLDTNNNEISRIPAVPAFSKPMSPPIRPPLTAVGAATTPVMKTSSPPLKPISSPPPPSTEPNNVPAPFMVKAEPPGSPARNDSPLHNNEPSPKDDNSNLLTAHSNAMTPKLESEVQSDPSRTSLVNLIRDMVRTRPIVGLNEVIKRIQQTIGLELLQARNILPGSEAERELLTTWILESLADADARQINVPWPTIPTALPQDVLITAIVGGTECGAVSEVTQKLRGVILELFESCSSVRIKEVQDKLDQLTEVALPKKSIYAMLKQYCVFRHNRYFLRLTVSE